MFENTPETSGINETTDQIESQRLKIRRQKLMKLSKCVLDIVRLYKCISASEISEMVISKNQDGVEYKNMQRRIYDSINVMIALGLFIKKDHGIIQYNINDSGYSDRCAMLLNVIEYKREKLIESIAGYIGIKKLIARNQISSKTDFPKFRIPIFLVGIKEGGKAMITRNIEQGEFGILSRKPFSVKDENHILSELNLTNISAKDSKLIESEVVSKEYKKLMNIIELSSGYNIKANSEISKDNNEILNDPRMCPYMKELSREDTKYMTQVHKANNLSNDDSEIINCEHNETHTESPMVKKYVNRIQNNMYKNEVNDEGDRINNIHTNSPIISQIGRAHV